MRAEDVVGRPTWTGGYGGHQPGGKLGEMMNKNQDDATPIEDNPGWNEPGPMVEVEAPTGLPLSTEGYNSYVGKLYDDQDAPLHTRGEEPARKPDPEYEIMQRYDPRKVGEAHRTYHWKMAAVLVLVGFITTGVAAMTVHWRRDGCLLYKLTVLEGITDDCCSTDYMLPEILDYLSAQRTNYPPAAVPPSTPEEKPRCTNISSWLDNEARTAHLIVLFFISLIFLLRILAMVAFLRGGRRMKLFPILVLCCSFCEFLCILAYYLTWRKRFSTGPALWFVALQMLCDVVAYFSTKTSSRLDKSGKMMAKISVVENEVHNMPLKVKVVYGYMMLGYAVLFLPFLVPWKDDLQCGDDTPGVNPTTGEEVPAPCCVWYYLMYTRSRCESATSIFDESRASKGMMIATVIATVFLVIALCFQTKAAYLGWKHPTAFPKPGLISAWLMICCVALYGGISTTAYTQFTALYVTTCAYEVLNVALLHLLYWRYHSQLLSDNFNQRRVKAGPDAKCRKGPMRLGYDGHEGNTLEAPEEHHDTTTYHNTHRPIIVSTVETRRVKFLGQGYVRGNVQQQPEPIDINWEETGNPLDQTFPHATQ